MVGNGWGTAVSIGVDIASSDPVFSSDIAYEQRMVGVDVEVRRGWIRKHSYPWLWLGHHTFPNAAGSPATPPEELIVILLGPSVYSACTSRGYNSDARKRLSAGITEDMVVTTIASKPRAPAWNPRSASAVENPDKRFVQVALAFAHHSVDTSSPPFIQDIPSTAALPCPHSSLGTHEARDRHLWYYRSWQI